LIDRGDDASSRDTVAVVVGSVVLFALGVFTIGWGWVTQKSDCAGGRGSGACNQHSRWVGWVFVATGLLAIIVTAWVLIRRLRTTQS